MTNSARASFKSIFLILTIFAFSATLNACRTLSAKQTEQREALTKKLEDYAALYASLEKRELTKGTSAEEIRGRYGPPDDIFSSGNSASGRLEIWNYGKLISRGIDTWKPIRLYFTNNRLMDWNY